MLNEAAQSHQGRGDARVDDHEALTTMHATFPVETSPALSVEHQQRRPTGVQRRRACTTPRPSIADETQEDGISKIPQTGVRQPVELPRIHRTRLPSHRPPGGRDGGPGGIPTTPANCANGVAVSFDPLLRSETD